MHLHRIRAVVLFLVGASAIASPYALGAMQARGPILSIEGLGKGAVEIDGPWQFHLGDDPRWARADVDDATGRQGWEQISPDDSWGSQTHPGYTGFAWYRKRIQFTVAPGVNEEISLLTRGIDDASEVYWNGVLVGTNGRLPPRPEWDTVQRSHIVHLSGSRDGVLAIRVWKAPLDPFSTRALLGGFENSPMLGDLGSLKDLLALEKYRHQRWQLLDNGLGIAFGLIGCVCLVGWLRQRDQAAIGWLSIFCLLRFLQMVLDPNKGSYALSHIRDVIESVRDAAAWFFLIYLYNFQRRTGLLRIVRIAAAACVAATVANGGLAFLIQVSPRWMTAHFCGRCLFVRRRRALRPVDGSFADTGHARKAGPGAMADHRVDAPPSRRGFLAFDGRCWHPVLSALLDGEAAI